MTLSRFTAALVALAAFVTLTLLSVATPAQAQGSQQTCAAWYRLSHASAATLDVLPVCWATGSGAGPVPNGFTLWVECAQTNCASARQALHDYYIATKQVPDWRFQKR